MNTTTPIVQTASYFQSYGGFTFAPGIFASSEDGDDYLSSLDSDTRDYVIKHTSEFRSMADIIECVNKLHKIS